MFQDVIDKVPRYAGFLTVKEMDDNSKLLARKYPDAVALFEAGRSKNGHPIYCLKIGNGSKNALAYGCPHPNEPIGAMMLEYLSEYLAENKAFRESLDYTWYIVKCSDPDGTMLNEGWFKGPFTLFNYARHFFRPPSHQQVDWTFPIQYKKLDFNAPIPETRALMRIIESSRPAFIYPLHNSGFGGAYWYMSGELPGVNEKLNGIPGKYGIPLDLGEPEAPYAVALGPAIYKALSIKDEYDYLEKYGTQAPWEVIKCGTSSGDYAGTFGDAFGLVCEVPYFYDARVNDTSETDVLRKDAVLESCAFQERLYKKMADMLDRVKPYISGNNIFGAALMDVAQDALPGIEAKRQWAESRKDFLRNARVSEAFESLYVSKFYSLLSLGMLLRAIESEPGKADGLQEADGAGRDALRQARSEAEEELTNLCDMLEKGMNYSVIPIQKLVRIQLESGLVVASEIAGRIDGRRL